MKAIVCAAPGALQVVDRPLPVANDGWLPVDIRFVGVCGTDFHIFQGKHPFVEYPRLLGHELSGVVAHGAASARLPAGTPVVVNPYLSCGVCIACRKGRPNCCVRLKVLGVHTDGGMCERIIVPEANLYPAGGLSLRDAAMVEFLSIGAHAVRRSEIAPGYRALVVGAGPIGIGTALFARRAGGRVTITDVSEKRLAFVRDKLGFADLILAGPGARAVAGKETDGEFYDVVFDATGNARAMEASFGFVAHTGTLVFVGVIDADITFSDPELHRREMRVLASRNAVKADFDQVVAAIASGDIPTGAINTHSVALTDLPEAMPAWLAAGDPPVKAILTL
ncbi:MAG: zinc-binding alcohol dehydrogenase family protein [Bauldia sp.]|nr:zinc-binding alcohol dehydrogenase family protein [Bauldia sp.]